MKTMKQFIYARTQTQTSPIRLNKRRDDGKQRETKQRQFAVIYPWKFLKKLTSNLSILP